MTAAVPRDLSRRAFLQLASGAAMAAAWPASAQSPAGRMTSWPLNTPDRTGIHDVAPAPDGGVWYTAQRSGHLGWFDPKTGRSELIALGMGSRPHGVTFTLHSHLIRIASRRSRRSLSKARLTNGAFPTVETYRTNSSSVRESAYQVLTTNRRRITAKLLIRQPFKACIWLKT